MRAKQLNQRSLLLILGVAAGYFVTGRLGVALAIPPGYATAIWPPSGIALAAVLLWGNRIWPGILLGSFLVNVSTGFEAASLEALWRSLLVPAAIAGGATLQAVGGALLARRLGGFPNPLHTIRQIAGLLMPGGVMGCTVNATIGTATLWAAERIPAANAAFTWLTWWGGDAIGVFVFTPVALALAMQPRAEWRRRGPVITAATLATFVLGIAVVAYANYLERQAFSTQLKDEGDDLAAALESAVTSRLHSVGALQAFMSHAGQVSPGEFNAFSSQLRSHIPGVLALEWIPRVPADQRPSFERWAVGQGLGNFQICESAREGLRPAAPRPDYFPVTFVEPAGGNRRAIGFDLGSETDRHEALERARDTAKIAVTGRIALLQGGTAVLAVAPVFGMAADGNGESGKGLRGFALGILRLEDLAEAILHGHDTTDLHYWLTDETPSTEPLVLSSNTDDAPAPFNLVERGLMGGSTSLEYRHALDVGGRHWLLRMAPTQEFLARHRMSNGWAILVGGMLASGLMGAFAMLITGREGELRAVVAERTRTLEDALGRLGQSEERLRATFEQTAIGFLHTGFDGALLAYNRRFCEIIGYPPDEVANFTWQRITHPDDMALCAGNVGRLMSGEADAASWDKRYIRKDGRVVWVRVSYSLQHDSAGRPQHFIAAVEDIDRQKRAEAELLAVTDKLRESEERFRLLFNSGNDFIWLLRANPLTGEPIGHFLEVNDIACRRLGYSREEMLRMGPANIDDPSTRPWTRRRAAWPPPTGWSSSGSTSPRTAGGFRWRSMPANSFTRAIRWCCPSAATSPRARRWRPSCGAPTPICSSSPMSPRTTCASRCAW